MMLRTRVDRRNCGGELICWGQTSSPRMELGLWSHASRCRGDSAFSPSDQERLSTPEKRDACGRRCWYPEFNGWEDYIGRSLCDP
jgi:hypothetical protein